jgi:hypothetical protein
VLYQLLVDLRLGFIEIMVKVLDLGKFFYFLGVCGF